MVAKIAAGLGYWLQGGTASEFNVGDGFVGFNEAGIVIRASQLSPLKIDFYLVQPELLNGLLTVAEANHLKQMTKSSAGQLVVFKAEDPLGQKSSRLFHHSQPESLSTRAMLVQFWAQALTGLLATRPAIGSNDDSHTPNLRERFLELVSKMPEAEIATRSPVELADKLHCSIRHFNRLFKEEMGVSFRARRTELRLQLAKKLLAESDAKIINIAFEAGYRHLGLFNLTFKKRFGVTPSELRWKKPSSLSTNSNRKSNSKITTALVLLLVLLTYSNQTVSAQASTNSFNATTNAPTSTDNAPHGFRVDRYSVSGNTILTADKIDKILAKVPGALGTNVTFEGIRAALGELQMAYRERGYVTVSVKLPPQKLTNATVKIQVIEEHLSDIKVQGNNYFSTENVLRALPSLHTNMLLNSHVFQRELDTANANRDRQIYPVISPGPEPGTTELTLKVKDTFPLHARLEINNQSTPGTPENRVVFNSQYDNLWDLEHQFGLNYSFTPLDFKTGEAYKVSDIDDPLIANYGAYYRIPLGGAQPVQEQIDNSGGSFGYNEVTHQYKLPPANGRPEVSFYANHSVSDTGLQRSSPQVLAETFATNSAGRVYPALSLVKDSAGQSITLNENLGTKFSLPLNLREIRGTASIGIDFKRYRETGFNTNENFFQIQYYDTLNNLVVNNQNVPQHLPTQRSAVDYFPLNVALNVSKPDKWGVTYFNAQANYNIASVGSLSDLAYSAGGVPTIYTNSHTHTLATNLPTNRARNNYFTVQAGVTREQRLYKDWTCLLKADGQWASCPLFSNEQYAMGGSAGVRGYSDGEAYGDGGWRVSIEPRTPMINIGMVDGDKPFWLRGSVFMDYGQTYLIQQISAGSSTSESFWGVGSSLTANIGTHLDGRLTLALPLLATAMTRALDLHFYFGVGAQF